MKHFDPRAALELKAADDPSADPSDVDTVKAINELATAVEEFKAANTGRLDDLEKKTLAKLTSRLDSLEAKMNRPAATETAAVPLEMERKAINTFLRSGVMALDEDERKALNIGTPSAGGYVTAPEYSKTIIEGITEFSPIRELATVMSIGVQKIYFPVLTGKLDGGWVTETGSRPESQPAFDQEDIEVFEHAVIVPVSMQLFEDNFVDLSSYLEAQIGQRFGKAESSAFVLGDGSGKPTGFLHNPSAFEQIAAAKNGSNIIEKAIELFYALPSTYAARGTWLMNRQTMGIIRKAADTSTKGTLWSDSLANGQPARFLGAPVREAVDMDGLVDTSSPIAATTYPIAFGDWSAAYRVVDRTGIAIKIDDLTGADNGLIKIRARRRVGGKVIQPEAIVLMAAS